MFSQVDAPVVLVGNKTDQIGDRMVTFEEGRRRCMDIGCVSFHEISVREHIEEVKSNILEHILLSSNLYSS
jgi:GTPase SAR1 family protein